MMSEEIRLWAPFIILMGLPVAIAISKGKRIGRKRFGTFLLISVASFFASIILGDKVSSFFYVLMLVAWWVLYYAVVQRLNDIGFRRWTPLWGWIPVVLLVFVFQCLFQRAQDELLD